MARSRHPQRKSCRLYGYDYNQPGAYFVTICTHHRECLFGEVDAGVMVLNESGNHVQSVWQSLPTHYSNIGLDTFVIMPNHVHGILWVGAIHESPLQPHPIMGSSQQLVVMEPSPSDGNQRSLLSKCVGRFKMQTAKWINLDRQTSGMPIWQRGYHDHIVRHENDLTRIREYIQSNPTQWALDNENPDKPIPTRVAAVVG